jgi:hypothetical protein
VAENKDYVVIQGQKFSKDMSDEDIAFVLNKKGAAFSQPKAMKFTGGDRPESVTDQRRAAGEKSLEEGKDTALKTLPLVGAVALSHATGVGEAADVAMLAQRFGPAMGRLLAFGARATTAALGAQAGSLAESAIRGESLPVASHKALSTANEYAAGQGIGEGLIGAAKEVAPKAVALAKNLPGGRYVMEKISGEKAAAQAAARQAVVEEGQAVTDKFLESITPVKPDSIASGGEASSALNSFETQFEKKAADMRAASLLVGKGKQTDITPLRRLMTRMENARTKTQEPFIKEATAPSGEYRRVTGKAAEGEIPVNTSPDPGSAAEEKLLKLMQDGALGKDGKIMAPLDLVMEARGNWSKRLNDPATPEDAKKLYRVLLDREGSPVDNFIKGEMEKVQPGSSSLWDAQKNFYAAKERIRSASLFKLASKDPSKLADYIIPGNPREAVARVAHIKLMAKEAQAPQVVKDVQRQWLEKLVTGKDGSVDLKGFDAKLKKYGDTAVNNLFAAPEEKASLNRMKEISGRVEALFNEPTIKAQQAKMGLMSLMHQGMAAAGIGGGMSAMRGPMAGAEALGATAAVGYIAPAIVVSLAESEAASKAFYKAFDLIKVNPSDPKALVDMTRAIKLAFQTSKAVQQTYKGAMSGAMEPLMPSH